MPERHLNATERGRTLKAFRAPPELLDALEKRAMQETVRSGEVVTASALIRRGIARVLAEPLGRVGLERECVLVPTAIDGGRRCLICRAESVAGEPECRLRD